MSRRLVCLPGEARCTPIAIARSVENLYEQYTVEVRLPNPQEVVHVGKVELEWVRTNPTFAPLLFGLKMSLLLVAVASAFVFHARMPAAPTFEQRCVGLLCVTLPLIDDPCATAIALVPGRVAALSSLLSVLSGRCCLLLFWLVQVDAFGSPPTRNNQRLFFLPKCALVLSMWAVRSTEQCLRIVHGWSSPLLPGPAGGAELQLVGVGLGAVYTVSLAYLLLRMLRRLHLLDARSRVAYCFTGCTAFVTLSGLAVGELAPTEQSVPRLFSGLVLVNLYGIALACCYLPATSCTSACMQLSVGSAAAGLQHSKTATPFCHKQYKRQVAVVSDDSSSC